MADGNRQQQGYPQHGINARQFVALRYYRDMFVILTSSEKVSP